MKFSTDQRKLEALKFKSKLQQRRHQQKEVISIWVKHSQHLREQWVINMQASHLQPSFTDSQEFIFTPRREWNLILQQLWTRAGLKLSRSGKCCKQNSETSRFAQKSFGVFVLLSPRVLVFKAFVNIWVLLLLNRRERISKVYIKLD